MRREARIRITFESGLSVECAIDSGQSPETVRALLSSLPFESEARLWGEEVYFSVPFSAPLENPKEEVDLGDVAYWPEEPLALPVLRADPLEPQPKRHKALQPSQCRRQDNWGPQGLEES